MPRLSKISMYAFPAQNVLPVRVVLDFKDFSAIAKETFARILVHAGKRGVLCAGGLFVCYHNSDLKSLDVEMMGYIEANGLKQAGGIYNYYLNDEDRDRSELLTRIVIPVS